MYIHILLHYCIAGMLLPSSATAAARATVEQLRLRSLGSRRNKVKPNAVLIIRWYQNVGIM